MYTSRNARNKPPPPSKGGDYNHNKHAEKKDKKKDSNRIDDRDDGGKSRPIMLPNLFDLLGSLLSTLAPFMHLIVVTVLVASLPIYFNYNNNYDKTFSSSFCYDEEARTDHKFSQIISTIKDHLFGDNSRSNNVYNSRNNSSTIVGPYYLKPEGLVEDGCKQSRYPHPLGLTLGLLAVAVGQSFLLLYFVLRKNGYLGSLQDIQVIGAEKYDMAKGIIAHLAQPEGFGLLGGYLIGTWMLGLMPSSYYAFTGGVNWTHVMMQLICQDFIQYIMHRCEHMYCFAYTHKPHHRFKNPKLFDAFNGSLGDTFLMILVPLFLTARIVPANVWSYMAFGSIYANWLTLIHSEFDHPWDRFFRMIGFGTAADHHVHHKEFDYNYGHLFLYWDRLFGTYRKPDNSTIGKSERKYYSEGL